MTQCHVLPIMSDRAATEGSKYFELGRQPHEFFLTRNTCSLVISAHKSFLILCKVLCTLPVRNVLHDTIKMKGGKVAVFAAVLL